MSSRQPIGYFTQGHGASRKVHPVCGPCTRYVAEMKKQLERQTRKAGVKRKMIHKQTFVLSGPGHTRLRAHKQALKGETGLNLKTTSKISRRYPGQVGAILEAAQSAYHYHHPESQVSAEPYELMEGGFVNEGLESLGLRPLA